MNSKLIGKRTFLIIFSTFICMIIASLLINKFVIQKNNYYNYNPTAITPDGLESNPYYGEESENYLYFIVKTLDDKESALLSVYKGEAINIDVPTSLDGLTVQYIGDSCFTNQTQAKSIKIANTIKEIGDFAFADCSNLTKILIPSSVNEIGEYIFVNVENVIIYCEKGSRAEQYAQKEKIPYKEISEW